MLKKLALLRRIALCGRAGMSGLRKEQESLVLTQLCP